MTNKAHVLVVDDNPPMTRTLADILTAKGFAVYTAFSGSDALKILKEQPVDILLTDVRMPDMNGVDLYRATRETHPHLVTFLMTAYSSDNILQEGLKEGIKTVLTKPLDIEFLLMLLSAAVNAYISQNWEESNN
jgi:DNA-binding response OmpR family regulator